jgi:hypothetical protein
MLDPLKQALLVDKVAALTGIKKGVAVLPPF